MASSEKRCHYEILGLNRDCTPEEIRSAYRKLALQRHPDKLIKTGIPEEEATAAFQELVNAYEVLSDPKERSWYDSHRSQILFSDSKSSKSSAPVPDLFSFFSNSVFSGFGDTGKGFYKVYADVFGKIYAQELLFARKLGLGEDSVKVAPLMGNLESDYAQVSAFYGYWLGFCTVMDFCWVDEYDVMGGPNRKSRRLMEDENKKLRKKARREYNETVRGLAEYAKKRDKRVIDMQMKKTAEMEKKREEEKTRKKEAERLKMERARMYEEPDWAKVDEEEFEGVLEEEEDESRKDAKELYCVFCSKKFKSDKQWKNHEQSKKHRERVAEFKDTLEEEEEEDEEEEEEEEVEGDKEGLGGDASENDADFGPSTVENAVDELCEQFENDIGFQEENNGFRSLPVDEEENAASNADNGDEISESSETIEETNNRKETTSGRKNKKKSSKRQPKMFPTEPQISAESEDMDLMECNSRRNARKNRAAKKEPVKKSREEVVQVEVGGDAEQTISNSDGSDVRHMEGSGNEHDILPVSEDLDAGNEGNNATSDKTHKVTNQPVKKKDTGKGDTKSKLKDTEKVDTSSKTRNTSKRKKQQRGESKKIDLSCQTCGEDFESRNKLHKHLSDTGHASLKSR